VNDNRCNEDDDDDDNDNDDDVRRRRFEGVSEDSRLKGCDLLCCWVHGS